MSDTAEEGKPNPATKFLNRGSETFLEDQEKLEEKFGVGVEAVPKLPPEPKLEVTQLNMQNINSVDSIVKELSKLPEIKTATEQTRKYDNYQAVAKRIWIIKQAENESFELNMRVVDKVVGDRKIWKRDKEGRPVFTKKRFYYTPITMQEKEELFKLLRDKQSADYDVTIEGQKLSKLAEKLESEPDNIEFTKKGWIETSYRFFIANQTYTIESFKAYSGATDEDVELLNFDDMSNFVEISMYKEGVKSPQ